MLSDTSSDAARVQMDVMCRLGPEHRGAMASTLTDRVFRAALEGLAVRRPTLSDAERRVALVMATYGRAAADGVAARLGVKVVQP